jgi:drug/metabolite transporter (DMT)-like permease
MSSKNSLDSLNRVQPPANDGTSKGSIPIRYFVLLVIACVMFGGQGTAIKILCRQLGPIQATFLPFCTATLLMIPFLVHLRSSPGAKPIAPADWAWLLLVGVGGPALGHFAGVWGISLSLVSNAAIIGLLGPIIIAVVAALMLHEQLRALHLTTLALGLMGAFLLSIERFRGASLIAPKYLFGNLLIIVSWLGSGIYSAGAKRLFSRLGEFEVLVFSSTLGSLASVPLLIWVEPVRLDVFRIFTWQSWVAFGYQALFSYFIAMLIFFFALKYIPVTTASVLLYLIPVVSVLLAVLVLAERISAVALGGGALILVSNIAFVKFARKS